MPAIFIHSSLNALNVLCLCLYRTALFLCHIYINLSIVGYLHIQDANLKSARILLSGKFFINFLRFAFVINHFKYGLLVRRNYKMDERNRDL